MFNIIILPRNNDTIYRAVQVIFIVFTHLVLLHPCSIAELLRVNIPQQFTVHHTQLLSNFTATVQVELLRQRGGATVDGGRWDTPTGAGEGVIKIQGNLCGGGKDVISCCSVFLSSVHSLSSLSLSPSSLPSCLPLSCPSLQFVIFIKLANHCLHALLHS